MMRFALVALAAAAAAGLLFAAGQSPVWQIDHREGFEAAVVDPHWWQREADDGCRIDLVEAPVRAGSQAVRFSVDRDGRCELVHWPSQRVLQWLRREPFDESRWYSFSTYIPGDHAASAPRDFELIAQWHGSHDRFLEPSGANPPLALMISDNHWQISGTWDSAFISKLPKHGNHALWRGAVDLGQWTDWVVHAIWTPNDDGQIDVWKNGERIVTLRGPTAFNDLRGIYFKVGIYHPRTEHSTIYLDEISVGPVNPLRPSQSAL